MKKLYLKDYGAAVNTAEDSAPAVSAALKAAETLGEPCEIVFESGVYNIGTNSLAETEIHVSNTIGEGNDREKGECDSIKRRTPFLLCGIKNITVNGNGAVIKSLGKMTQIILKNCKNITFKNITFDYLNPTVTEMTVTAVGKGYADCKISDEYPYRIKNDKIEWYGGGFAFSSGISQLYDPKSGFTWRQPGPMDDKNARFEELEKGFVRLYSGGDNNSYGACPGYVFQMRDPIRDECGIIIDGCENISFLNTTMHFMSGIGFIAQNSDGIHLDRFNVCPAPGRTASCAADFMHFSGCRGKIVIENGYYCGAHDDAINVHGTHLKITDVYAGGNKIKVRFMHPQSYGIGGFLKGDKICAIDPDTLLEKASTRVISAEEINPYEIILTVESCDGFTMGRMVENASATAEVFIRNNHFERIPTRGILVTTRKPVIIENNEFTKLTGCGVLIADDARSWFESGYVTDVTIRRNRYTDSKESFVRIEPECVPESEATVHGGVKITDNLIEAAYTDEVVYARNTDGVKFENNTVYGSFENIRLTLKNVKNASARGNKYNGEEWRQ